MGFMIKKNRTFWVHGIVSSLVLLLPLLLWQASAMTSTYAYDWQKFLDGLEYKKVIVQIKGDIDRPSSPGLIHIFRIDPLNWRLGIVTAKQLGLVNVDARTAAQKSGATIFINGGFFTPEYASLGLLVQDGRELNRIKWTSWWHIFQVKALRPKIISKQEFSLTPDIEMAIESGPRVLTGGSIPAGIKPSIAERSGLAIDKEGRILIAATEALPISIEGFANYLKAEGAVDAINLDGGSSTQLYAKIKNFELNRGGFGMVANGIGVFSR